MILLTLGVDAQTISILMVATLLTTILSGIIGLGGGMILLAVLFGLTDSHAEVICLHAFVQMVANATRAFALRKYVDWRSFGRFMLGALPGILVGGGFLIGFGELGGAGKSWLRVAIGCYVFAVFFAPKPKADKVASPLHFPIGGLVAGAMAPIVGATGPILASIYAVKNFAKESLVATLSASNMVLHPMKFIAFWLLFQSGGAAQPEWRNLLLLGVLMAAMAVLGTGIGKALLKKTSERTFRWLYATALIGAGAKILVWDGIRPLLGW